MSTTSQAVAETKTATTDRIITIVPTRGEKIKVAFNGNEWGGLQSLLSKSGKDVTGKTYSGYNLDSTSMKSVESTNNTTLEHPKAKLPEGDFYLFLMPYKSKSGATTKKAVKKAAPKKAAKKAAAKKVASKKAVSTKKVVAKKDTKVSTKKAKAITDVVESVKESKKVVIKTDAELDQDLRNIASAFSNVQKS